MKRIQNIYARTTEEQRKLLFENWEESKNITMACKKAKVGRSTFYYWKSRFEKEGYAGLEKYEKAGVSKGTGSVSAEIEAKVKEMRVEHPNWGKHRLSQEMAKANNWVPLVSPNTVRRVLEEAGLWQAPENKKKVP